MFQYNVISCGDLLLPVDMSWRYFLMDDAYIHASSTTLM